MENNMRLILLCLMAAILLSYFAIMGAVLLHRFLKYRFGDVFVSVEESDMYSEDGIIEVVHKVGWFKTVVWSMQCRPVEMDKEECILHALVIFNIYKYILENRITDVIFRNRFFDQDTSIIKNGYTIGVVKHGDERAIEDRVNEITKSLAQYKTTGKSIRIIETYRNENKKH